MIRDYLEDEGFFASVGLGAAGLVAVEGLGWLPLLMVKLLSWLFIRTIVRV